MGVLDLRLVQQGGLRLLALDVPLQGGPVLKLVDLRVVDGEVLLRVPLRRAKRAKPTEAREARARAAGRVHGRVDLVWELGILVPLLPLLHVLLPRSTLLLVVSHCECRGVHGNLATVGEHTGAIVDLRLVVLVSHLVVAPLLLLVLPIPRTQALVVPALGVGVAVLAARLGRRVRLL